MTVSRRRTLLEGVSCRVNEAARQLCASLSPDVMHDYHYYDLCFQAVRKEANDDLQQALHGDWPRLAAIVLRYGA
jgi:hypothetical protein